MADLITEPQIAAWVDTYHMGNVWTESDAAERLKAVNTVEGIWRGYFWRVSPFSDADIAAQLQYPLALHARAILGAEGEVTEILNPAVEDILQPYFRKRIMPLRLSRV